MNTVSVSELRQWCRNEMHEAADLLGRGMCQNPVNIRAFGMADAERRRRALKRFFLPVLHRLCSRGVVLGAFSKPALVGVCALARPGFCQPAWFEKLKVLPAVVLHNPLGTPLRVLRWTGAWASRDPVAPHWHLGPVAVAPEVQGRGIGGIMLEEVCARLDAYCMPSYLETDKRENVSFYQKFGFAVTGEADVLGIRTWFMSRPRRTTAIAPEHRP